MATNKNQHYVPKCYLRPFTLDAGNKAISLFNIDHQKVIPNAPVKNQCSGSYFYGEDLVLERAFQGIEGEYATVVRELTDDGAKFSVRQAGILLRFWLLQYLRTEGASRRAVELFNDAAGDLELDPYEFKLSIKEGVILSLEAFSKNMNAVDDLHVCMIRNRTSLPFITSDDPAVLSNRWQMYARQTVGYSIGLQSAGNLIFLPLSPSLLCLAYDGDVYKVQQHNSWVDVKREVDVQAFNQQQFLNCRANVFFGDLQHSQTVIDAYTAIEDNRLYPRHQVNYAVYEHSINGREVYRAATQHENTQNRGSLMLMESLHPKPKLWPSQIVRKQKGHAYTDGSAVGYIRHAWAARRGEKEFRKERISS